LENEQYLGNPIDFSMIMCDLDNFKSVNDRFGHSVGDDTLALFGKLIIDTLRPSDFAYRYGGEEFIILLPNTELNDAVLVAERLRKVIEERLLVGNFGLNQITAFDLDISAIPNHEDNINDAFFLAHNVTCSFGVANYLEQGQSTEALFDAADANLYIAKKSGRNKVSA